MGCGTGKDVRIGTLDEKLLHGPNSSSSSSAARRKVSAGGMKSSDAVSADVVVVDSPASCVSAALSLLTRT